ncbi:MAG: ABC transporter ATP-binding protein [Alphaproteobacteria bacterium]|nr:ABC transporter ATP-binding protein [Alphaproteobacteria bacterium]
MAEPLRDHHAELPDGLVAETVSHAYGATTVLDDVSLRIAPGELVCLLGPSGCGKTTMLRVLAGIERLQKGRVVINRRLVAAPRVHVPPEARAVGLLFQDFALFPHLTVAENVAFGISHLAAAERADRVREVLDQLGILDLADHYPATLSGGQQQRAALARARAPRPRLFLMDEPFSNLDVRLRHQLRDTVLHVLKNTTASTLMVTHDPEEAMFMGDRIAVMDKGRIVQEGPPETLYRRPVNAFVAGLFSEVNRLVGRVASGHVRTAIGVLCTPTLAEGTPVEVLVRPEGIALGPTATASNRAAVGTVLAARMLGGASLIHLSIPDTEGMVHVHARVAGVHRHAEREEVGITIDPDQAFVFPLADTTS